MFECVSRGTLCDSTCVDCPRRPTAPKSKEEYESALKLLSDTLGMEIPSSFLSLTAAELAEADRKVHEGYLRMLGLPNAASGTRGLSGLSFPAHRKETPCTNCGPVDCAAHVGLCSTCAAFVDLIP